MRRLVRRIHGCSREGMDQRWQVFFRDPNMWWDNRAKKRPDSKLPDFKHVSTGDGLWLDSAPSWVLTKLTTLKEAAAFGSSGKRAEFKYESEVNRPSVVNYVDILESIKCCGAAKDLQQGRKWHSVAKERGCLINTYVASALVTMYAKCESMSEAEEVFMTLTKHETGCWNALIFGYVANGKNQEAFEAFQRMNSAQECQPDARTYVGTCMACARLPESATKMQRALEIHQQVVDSGLDSNTHVGNALLDMLVKCGRLDLARTVFDRMGDNRDTITWNGLIFGYAHGGLGELALELYTQMDCQPNVRTFVATVAACSDLACKEKGSDIRGKLVKTKSLHRGLAVHSRAATSCCMDTYLGAALINMYSRCGSMEEARKVFYSLKIPDVVTLNALLHGYVDHGEVGVALALFRKFGELRDERTYSAALSACGQVMAASTGEEIHRELRAKGMEKSMVLSTSLLDFYAQCGDLVSAHELFESMSERDSAAWNCLLGAYAQQGDALKTLGLFEEMRKDNRVKPNEITFVFLLTACGHAGLVEQGKTYFSSMSTEYQVPPNVRHYTCMVDLLGRANLLDEAVAMVEGMPDDVRPDKAIYRCLLGACRKWSNVCVAEWAFERLKQDTSCASSFVLMANIYGGVGMWEHRKTVLAAKEKASARKKPGETWWTDQSGTPHKFTVGDMSKRQLSEVRARLKELSVKLKELGYVPDLASVTAPEVEEAGYEDKEEALCGHSEKLAIGYALVKTEARESIRIAKNLRVCTDCHTATALISKIEERKIVCRDASRIHVFENGKCSCGDYW